MTDAAPDITVSIVSYNTCELLRACLQSLTEREKSGEATLEIVVADNGSTDGSVEMIKSEFPGVKVVETGGNIGYGRANNAALENAQGRHFLILNSDTEVEENALAVMRDFLDANAQVGAVGGRLILPDGTTQPSCAADPTLASVFYEQTYLYKLFPDGKVTGAYLMTDWDYGERRSVEQVCGACVMVKRATWNKIGGFDPAYFMYFEDTDLCVRIRETNQEIWFLPDAKIQHKLGASSGKDWHLRAQMIASYNQSRYYFYRKRQGKWAGVKLKFTVLLGATLRLLTWTLLALTGRRRAREEVQIWRDVWQRTARMTAKISHAHRH